jgi:hypothetical protein
MKANLSALAAGLLFGLGLMLSGMSNPGEVLSFLDWSGEWSPDLVGVLGSAVLVSVIGFQLARRRKRPWFEDEFPVLPKKPIDRSLLIGNLLFGIGWGLAGYCPGPAERRAAERRQHAGADRTLQEPAAAFVDARHHVTDGLVAGWVERDVVTRVLPAFHYFFPMTGDGYEALAIAGAAASGSGS